jgi:RNA polymerase sigma factor (sigma-70 family)
MSDKILWQSLKAGNQKALEEIYRAHAVPLLKYGQRFSQDGQLVEDSLQDLFVELWKNRAGLGENDAIRKYLFVALRRKIIRNLNPIKRVATEEPEERFFQADFAIDEKIMEQESQVEQKEKLEQALAQLSERQQEVLYLKFFADMDYPEICEVMDINYQSVRNLAFRALQALREGMSLILLFFLLKNLTLK